MENASKALIIAGSVLISLLVIALLVFGYNQLSDLEQIREDAKVTDALAEYMRQFEQYNRTLYGSELLSLANLQEDYNEKVRSQDEGYEEVTITVEIVNGIVGTNYFRAGKNSLSEIADDGKSIQRRNCRIWRKYI